MAAPVQNYVNNSGSLFRIDRHEIDLELVTSISDKPVFQGSGSISPTSFKAIVDGNEMIINNSEELKNFNKEAYLFPTTKYTVVDLGELLNMEFRYSSSLNVIIITPPGNFVTALTNYYGLAQANISKSFQNDLDKRASHGFNSSGLTYVNDVSSSLYGLTYINLLTSSLGSSSTGSIFVTQSIQEYRYDFISASIDLYNSFVSKFNLMSSSLKQIKGSIN